MAAVVLREMLTAKRLFLAASNAPTLARVLTYRVPAPSAIVPRVAPKLDGVVLRGLRSIERGEWFDLTALVAPLPWAEVQQAQLFKRHSSPWPLGAWLVLSPSLNLAARLPFARLLHRPPLGAILPPWCSLRGPPPP